MDNDKLMARLAALPAPDFMLANRLSDPIGSGSAYRTDTVVRLIDEAVAAERERCAKLCDELALHYSADEGAAVADHCALAIRA